MKLLALDTATEACSAALYIDGEISEKYQLAPREHTRLILQMASELLALADIKMTDLDALAFGRGPGSFTGVRIATGVVQGMAFATDLPVVPVSTLASIAQWVHQAYQQDYVLSAIDARMGEMYWGCYQKNDHGLMELMGDERVTKPQSVSLPAQFDGCGAGSAFVSYSEQLHNEAGIKMTDEYADIYPHSHSIARLAAHAFKTGHVVEPSQALPVYLRNNVAKKAKQA